MRRIALLLLLAVMPLLSQGEGPPTDAPKPDAASETEDQKNAREVSLIDLREADARLNSEREAVTRRERRLAILMESLKNEDQAITAKEDTIQKLLRDFQSGQDEVTVPGVQVQHWEARNPKVAAKDFAILYQNEPSVAVGLVKAMKKKKSAALIDEVSKLEEGINGKKIAADLHEAIGTGIIKE